MASHYINKYWISGDVLGHDFSHVGLCGIVAEPRSEYFK